MVVDLHIHQIFDIRFCKLLHNISPFSYNHFTCGVPIPAATRSFLVIFPRLQQSRIFPSTTTVGTELTLYFLALFIPFSRRSYIFTSQSGQEVPFISFTASSHNGHPATKTSTFLFFAIFVTSSIKNNLYA